MPNAVHCLRALGLADRIAAVPALHTSGSVHTWRRFPGQSSFGFSQLFAVP
ncbi:MAG TPA: hypothetical protein VJ914_10955 [Pseudonocardiaceae bacterium]|nr:hypothetical protein [Pseudonocardiaceae bacterium]